MSECKNNYLHLKGHGSVNVKAIILKLSCFVANVFNQVWQSTQDKSAMGMAYFLQKAFPKTCKNK